jgi:biopolymer transport protein ExbD
MGYNDRHESGASSAVLVVAVVLALLLGVPLVLGVVLVFVGGLFFVSVRSEPAPQIPVRIAESAPADSPPDALAPPTRQPNTEPSSDQEAKALEIKIDEMGQLHVDGMDVMNDDELRRIIENRVGDAASEATASVRAHPNAKHADVVRVVDLLKKAGVSNVTLVVSEDSAAEPEPDEPSEPPARNSSEP